MGGGVSKWQIAHPKTLCTLSPLTLTMHFLAQTKDEPNMDWIEDS